MPLILQGPGITPGVSRRTASGMDLAPTLLALVGVSSEALRAEGQNLLSSTPAQGAFSETTPQSGVHGQRTRQERKTSSRTRRYSKFQTDEGKKYFVPVSGDGKAVWKLPEDATLVTL